jgi:predicted secreted protein
MEARSMTNKLKFSLIAITFAAIAVSCKKSQNNNPAAIQITGQNSGQTTTLSTGRTMRLTLSNPGDGGYSFDPPKYNSSIITLKTHTRILPGPGAAIGNFGSDAWEFIAIGRGSGRLTITATRGTDKTSTTVIFDGLITIE